MLYRVLIVDDEKIMREGLAKFMNWKSMGFEVADKVNDGRDAIEYIEKNPVDVVLSDIKMTFVSGIELAKYIYDRKLPIKVVLVSGFKEFDYARQALQYQVADYILKPISTDEASEVFSKLRRTMDTERASLEKRQSDKEQYEDLRSILKEQFFSDLVFGALRNPSEIKRRSRILGIKFDLEADPCCVVDASIGKISSYKNKGWDYGREGFYNAVINFFQTAKEEIRFYHIINARDCIKLLAVSNTQGSMAEFKQGLQGELEAIEEEIKKFFGFGINIRVEKYYKSVLDLSMDATPVKAVSHTVSPDVLKATGEKDFVRILEQTKLLVTHVSSGDYPLSAGTYESFLQEIGDLDIKIVHTFIINLFAILFNKLVEIGMEASILNQQVFYYDEILSKSNIAELKEWGMDKLRLLIDKIKSGIKPTGGNAVSRVKQYIKENYGKDITLEDIADYLFLNPAYLSRLFKEQTGENFTDYLIHIRMENALEFLKDSRYKVHEVSNMVGYESLRYFYKVFRRCTGQTPTEYRKCLWGEYSKEE